jgi:molybdenum cofactor cytidylyltransferase
MSDRKEVVAVVLAAGRGERMGADKALLDLGGEPALSRMIRVLREAGVSQIVVVLREVRAAHRRALHLEGLTTALNPDPAAGQLASIRIGLANVRTRADGFLLCPVDVPLFDVDDVRALLAGFAAAGDEIAIVVPSDGRRRGHPALYAASLAAEFRALEPASPPNAVVRRDPARVLHVPLANPELYSDLDSKADLGAALERRGLPLPPAGGSPPASPRGRG